MTPVLLCPGLLCDARVWHRVAPHLDGPATILDFTEAPSLPAMAEIICAAARSSPAPCVLVGFSMGAMAAILAARRLREAGAGAALARLILLGTHADPDDDARRAARHDQIARARRHGFEDLVRGELKAAYFSHRTAPEAEADRRLTYDMALRQGPDVFCRHVGALIERPDLGAALSDGPADTMIVAGEAIAWCPPRRSRACAPSIRARD